MLALMRTYDPAGDAQVDLRNSANLDALEEGRLSGLSSIVDGNLGALWGAKELRLTSITSSAKSVVYRRDLDADFSPVPFITDTLLQPSRSRQLSQEFHLRGEVPSLLGWGQGVSFVFGSFFFDRATALRTNSWSKTSAPPSLTRLRRRQGMDDGGPALGACPATIGGQLRWYRSASCSTCSTRSPGR